MSARPTLNEPELSVDSIPFSDFMRFMRGLPIEARSPEYAALSISYLMANRIGARDDSPDGSDSPSPDGPNEIDFYTFVDAVDRLRKRILPETNRARLLTFVSFLKAMQSDEDDSLLQNWDAERLVEADLDAELTYGPMFASFDHASRVAHQGGAGAGEVNLGDPIVDDKRPSPLPTSVEEAAELLASVIPRFAKLKQGVRTARLAHFRALQDPSARVSETSPRSLLNAGLGYRPSTSNPAEAAVKLAEHRLRDYTKKWFTCFFHSVVIVFDCWMIENLRALNEEKPIDPGCLVMTSLPFLVDSEEILSMVLAHGMVESEDRMKFEEQFQDTLIRNSFAAVAEAIASGKIKVEGHTPEASSSAGPAPRATESQGTAPEVLKSDSLDSARSDSVRSDSGLSNLDPFTDEAAVEDQEEGYLVAPSLGPTRPFKNNPFFRSPDSPGPDSQEAPLPSDAPGPEDSVVIASSPIPESARRLRGEGRASFSTLSSESALIGPSPMSVGAMPAVYVVNPRRPLGESADSCPQHEIVFDHSDREGEDEEEEEEERREGEEQLGDANSPNCSRSSLTPTPTPTPGMAESAKEQVSDADDKDEHSVKQSSTTEGKPEPEPVPDDDDESEFAVISTAEAHPRQRTESFSIVEHDELA